MGRPPQHKPLQAKHHVCTWVHGNGRGSRGLYAEQRGQFVQARISGYSMKAREFFAPDFVQLGYDVARIVSGWGPGWSLKGQSLRSRLSMSMASRAVVQGRAGQ